MITKIKTLLGLTDCSKDELILALKDIAESEVKAYCNIDDISGLESAIIQIVILKYNRLGTEGISSESYSGISANYCEDYPPGITRMLNQKRRLKVL